MTNRFIVGIDLGTTNCALSYVDLETSTEPQLFEIEQVIAYGEKHQQYNLPSFLYRCEENEQKQLALAWDKTPKYVSGEYARRFGGAKADRFIHSAKSWLVHKAVDREQAILPWGIEEDEKISPLAASAFYLKHLREAWNHQFGKVKDKEGSPCFLEDQELVITVPASFDEVARELSLKAAFEAGFKKVTLLEEPLAAFYSWLQVNQNWQEILKKGERVLIIDIGGGTSDFSMIEVSDDESLRRNTVGPHLLLGGDNIDRTIAFEAQRRAKKKFNQREMSSLIQEARRAKEKVLGDEQVEDINLSVHSGGSSLLKGMSLIKFKRSEILDIIHSGFFPQIAIDAEEPDRKVGLRTLDLPYERDPAITSHLLSFLRKDAQVSGYDSIKFPEHILFNGGTMIPLSFRERILKQLEAWSGQEINTLNSKGLDIAVAHGASAYGLSKSGLGTQVKGGIARSYFLQIASEEGDKFICIMPRDTEEHSIQSCDKVFTLKTNSIVSFPLYSSETRLQDQAGDILASDAEDISVLSPLSTSISYGKKIQDIRVKIKASVNESNSLEVWLEAIDTDHKWQLRFDLRQLHEQEVSEEVQETITVDEELLTKASQSITEAFTESDSKLLKSLMNKLEADLELPRKQWSLVLCRRLADLLLDLDSSELRKKASTEARYYNILGFMMRPGFGDSHDQFRVNKLWPFWFKGVQNKNDLQSQCEWWTLWRRCTGALSRGRQEQMAHKLATELNSKKNANAQLNREIKRCLGALELSPIKFRRKILGEFNERATRLDDVELWMIARMAARRPIYAPLDLVLPAKSITSLTTLIMQTNPKKLTNMHYLCLSRVMSLTGNPSLDIAEKNREAAIQFLKKNQAPKHFAQAIQEVVEEKVEDQSIVLGDSIPIGLKLHQD
ncbi:putative heat shock protein 70, dnaK [Lentisphaera araneosa HTCC2155]|uniref:Putative heat shock protein 70, dnaK n=1 Tax=Lentisphaera araneosa HTCC2155 TaxID=313628 RepID=A6DQF5_9BACT|nr:hsp70 family protein [Lentisphaera araneosa]EDM26206.1 putative heat shock protein 70, dnaK [Lentisphaera araneosa HTCC2155]